MNREEAEKLLAAMIFDDLDEPSRAELLAYLQTDDELRDRLADMRMAVKLTCDAVNDGPDPVLDERRLKQLQRLAKAGRSGSRVFTFRRLLAVAAVLTIGVVFVGVFVPSLSHVRYSRRELSYSVSNGARTGLDGSNAEEATQLHYFEPSRSPANRLHPGSVRPPGGTAGMRGTAFETTNGAAGGGMGGYGGSTGGMGGYGGGMMGGMAINGDGDVPSGGPGGYAGAPRGPQALTGDARVTNELAVAQDGYLPSSSRAMNRSLDMGEPVGREPEVLDQTSRFARKTNGTLSTDQSQLRPQPEQPVGRMGGGAFGQGVEHAWSDTVSTGKPVSPVPAPAPTDSKKTSDEQPGSTSPVAGPAEAHKRVPSLGDMPTEGELFRRGRETAGRKLSPELPRESRSTEERLPDSSSALSSRMEAELPAQETVKADAQGLPFQSRFAVVPVNPWVMTDRDPLSTFALDVDTASYALCRRYIRSGFLPPVGAVRMEEFINAFDYAYPQRDGATFAVYAEGAPSPFASTGQDLTLLKIAVKARTVGRDQRRAAHIVFVVDASASMGQVDRLPQVQAALNLLVDKLSEVDRISLVTCADQARLHLEAIPAREKDTIRRTIDAIQPAGPTNLLAGLKVGYDMARRAFVAGQINQVVLCSDGVANVGQTEAQEVLEAVAEDRRQGITLTCVGVGYGAYNDAFLEAVADRGDGRYVFLDSSEQAREDLVGQLAATLQTVARDARIQVQFNPARVRRYRLIGYENRDIEDRRFRDDTVDAGEVGSGQCSTALYELELAASSSSGEGDRELGTVSVRYRNAETGQIEEISRSLAGSIIRRQSIEENPRFYLAAGTARFAEWLRQSEHARDTMLADVQDVLDRVGAVLSLDRTVQDLAALAHEAESLPRATETTIQP